MRSLYLAVAFFTLFTSSSARADGSASFDVAAYSETFDGSTTLTAKKGKPLAEIELAAPFAVQLDGEVPAAIQKKIVADPKLPLSTGSVLFSSKLNQKSYGNIYCGLARPHSVGRAGPCLIDTDNDYQFDTAIKAGAMSVNPTGMSIANNSILGVVFAKPIPMPLPVPYHRIDATLAPRAKGYLKWASNYKAKRPGPVSIVFQFDGSDPSFGTGLVSEPVHVTFTGSPVTVDLNGIKVTVLNIGQDGELIYQLSGGLDAAPLYFTFMNRVVVIHLYLPY